MLAMEVTKDGHEKRWSSEMLCLRQSLMSNIHHGARCAANTYADEYDCPTAASEEKSMSGLDSGKNDVYRSVMSGITTRCSI
jgi:hypothetical protein